jgi:hypothetical protein
MLSESGLSEIIIFTDSIISSVFTVTVGTSPTVNQFSGCIITFFIPLSPLGEALK